MIFRKDENKLELKTNMRGGEGTVKLAALCGELPANARLFSEIRVEPGCSIGYHVHENETELFYFLSGEAEIQDDDDIYTAYPGDVVSTASGHGHSVTNKGKTDVVMLACIVLD